MLCDKSHNGIACRILRANGTAMDYPSISALITAENLPAHEVRQFARTATIPVFNDLDDTWDTPFIMSHMHDDGWRIVLLYRSERKQRNVIVPGKPPLFHFMFTSNKTGEHVTFTSAERAAELLGVRVKDVVFAAGSGGYVASGRYTVTRVVPWTTTAYDGVSHD